MCLKALITADHSDKVQY